MKIELPKTVTAKLYMYLTPYGSVVIEATSDMSGHGWIVLAEHEVTYDVPQEDPTAKVVKALEAKAVDIKAEADLKVKVIRDQIASMLCIEHKPV